MKVEILIPNLISGTFEVTVDPNPVGRSLMSDEIEFSLFGQPHILTFTIDEIRGEKTLYYTLDNSDSQIALREEEFNYRVIE